MGDSAVVTCELMLSVCHIALDYPDGEMSGTTAYIYANNCPR